MKIAIINGPNLNLLGKRQPEVYGRQSFEDYLAEMKAAFPSIQFHYFQSNVEGELINEIQRVGFEFEGMVFNPGGYTHTSVALGDAVAAVKTPVVEVHISNIFAREEYRKVSFVSPHCKGVISGLGLEGYTLAVRYLIKVAANHP